MTLRRPTTRAERQERRAAWLMAFPALGTIVLVALFPLAWTVWESLHLHDLRMPWRGRPFVGLENYAELLSDPRFGEALRHTALFVVVTVAVELALGLTLALGLDRIRRGRGPARVLVLLPWAVPTAVAALVWGFMFEGRTGVANELLGTLGILDEPIIWFVGATSAWVPVMLADVWKMTPFVTLLLLAGLQNIPDSLHEAARMDGAGPWLRFREVTLPLLRPALLVALLFRTLDALRVFDLVYVLTGGGPGTATEPLSVYAFDALLRNLRFGYGSALSVTIFVLAFALALLYIRVLGGRSLRGGAT
ncbi:MAG TPA: sugar ABC transporter permease [Longimicrobiales bacterium]|nr:sugar ABC transporter permease [Longimicrobiales bacterium]